MRGAAGSSDPGAAGAAGVREAGDRWTVLRLMRWSGEYLEGKGVERGRLDAEHLLAHTLGLNRLDLYLQFDRPLTAPELDAFRPLLRRRAAREPLQYILGRAAFRELDLVVDPRVLIPRPETEELVEAVLAWAGAECRDGLSAVDVGTGSGAIALSLALEGGFGRIVATDPAPEALEVARENARRAGLEDRVEFRRGEGFEPFRAGERFDVLVSNPPYVAEGDEVDLEPEVKDHEPGGALFAGPDGLDVLRALVSGAAGRVNPGGLVALEVGREQAPTVAGLLRASGAYDDVRVRRDLAGRERFILARRTGAASRTSETGR